MKVSVFFLLLLMAGLAVYWPHRDAQFVLDDNYTIVHNPLIKNPSFYPSIWTSRLFDASQSSGYIKFGYWRPVLQSSWIVDYSLFGLKASGYQWINLLVHGLTCILIYVLLCRILGQPVLAAKTALLFCVLPSQEWVVRYVTGRGDELSALFALLALLIMSFPRKQESKNGDSLHFFVPVFICWALAALTREVAISYILYAFLIYAFRRDGTSINRLSLFWVLIGIAPLLVIGTLIPKEGNILSLHLLYFASVGFCLWLAQFRLRWMILLFAFFAAISFYQGRFWTSEETLLRHTRSLEWWPNTVAEQQLLMKYDEDVPAIKDMAEESNQPLIKAMWFRRLGQVYFLHKDFTHAREYLSLALAVDPFNADTLDALSVLGHTQGREDESLMYLQRSLSLNATYPETLRLLGIHYYLAHDLTKARMCLSQSLLLDPDNAQTRQLLDLANHPK